MRLSRNVRLNVGTRGISSLSFGRPGSTVNVGGRGVRSTVGIPGTGLSYSSRSSALGVLIGTLVAGAVALLLLAARGNRPAQATLVAAMLVGGYVALRSAPRGDQPRTQVAVVAPEPTIAASTKPERSPATAVLAATTMPSATMVAITSINIRSNPSAQAPVLGQLRMGDLVAVGDETDGWVRTAALGDRPAGWVNKRLLRQR